MPRSNDDAISRRVQEIVDAAPPLTPEKAAKIRAILWPAVRPRGEVDVDLSSALRLPDLDGTDD